jgi:hypothetical protein
MITSNTPSDRPYYADDAAWLDSQWFQERPERQYRLRPMHRSEFNEFGGSTHILVQKITSFERQRQPLSLLAVPPRMQALLQGDLPLAPDLDAVLGEMFAALLTGRTFDLRQVMRSAREKYEAATTNTIVSKAVPA